MALRTCVHCLLLDGRTLTLLGHLHRLLLFQSFYEFEQPDTMAELLYKRRRLAEMEIVKRLQRMEAVARHQAADREAQAWVDHDTSVAEKQGHLKQFWVNTFYAITDARLR